jgi:hypothetical protein
MTAKSKTDQPHVKKRANQLAARLSTSSTANTCEEDAELSGESSAVRRGGAHGCEEDIELVNGQLRLAAGLGLHLGFDNVSDEVNSYQNCENALIPIRVCHSG